MGRFGAPCYFYSVHFSNKLDKIDVYVNVKSAG